MSLQTYDINIGVNKTQKVAAQGRYIYYLKGTTALITAGNTPAAAYNHEIKATTGSTSIVLRPGQSYRVPDDEKAPSEWLLTNSLNAETITGTVFVGEGDFNDNNTNQTNFLKLDATFANNVKVTNTTAERVPVSMDLTQTVPVSLAAIRVNNTTAQRVPVTLDPTQVLNTAESILSYTNYRKVTIAGGGQNIALFTAAENVNGIIIEQITATAAGFNLLAKAGVVAGQEDGDVILVNNSAAPTTKRILIAAGKSAAFYNSTITTFYCLYTVL